MNKRLKKLLIILSAISVTIAGVGCSQAKQNKVEKVEAQVEDFEAVPIYILRWCKNT